MSPLRVGILTHSTNPRGGVVHALELSEALHDLGVNVTLLAVDEEGKEFFRPVRCKTRVLHIPQFRRQLKLRVEESVAAYLAHFTKDECQAYDILHAQDAISGCAMAELSKKGYIPNGFIRTVHHLDVFSDPILSDWQLRSFKSARQVLCVSQAWIESLQRDFDISALKVSNGVNTNRFSCKSHPGDRALRQRLGLTMGGPVFLAVGGIEVRKNTKRIFEAFLRVMERHPLAQLLIIGGASLQDHYAYRMEFDAVVSASGLAVGPGHSLIVSGPLADEDMPGVFRLADALVFPSQLEGFGLVVLEALVSGTPVVASRKPPFTEYLETNDCIWTNPDDVHAIAQSMLLAVETSSRDVVLETGKKLAGRFSWNSSATTHREIYSNYHLSQ